MTNETVEASTTTEAELRAEIQRLRAAMKGPEGFETWQEAFAAEHLARVKAEQSLFAKQVSGMDGWVLLDLAIQCARNAKDPHDYLPCDAQTQREFQPHTWVLDAMRAAIRWDRLMNRDVAACLEVAP